jgi:hypothetical protein
MATTRNATLYKRLHVDKYPGAAAWDRGGRAVPIPFEHTVVSGETGGASAGTQDKVNLCVIPANSMVVGLDFNANNIWASAGTNGTLQLGDSGDDDRYLIATEAYTAGGLLVATNPGLAFAGQNYKPTADTVVQLTWKVANPVVGKIIRGCFWVVPGT